MSEVWSHGLQVERTLLAWTRTSLAMAAASLLLVRVGLSRHSLVIAVAAAASLVAWLVLAVISRRRYRKVNDDLADGSPHSLMLPGWLAATAIVLLAAAALLLALT